MSLHADSKFPTRRAYVVKLRSDATRDELRGRIENIVTCRQGEFASARELVDLLLSDLDAPGGAPGLR